VDKKCLQVSTLDRSGAPHLTTLWYGVVDRAKEQPAAALPYDLVFLTYSKSQKIRNLERDPRIAVLVEDGTAYGELRGVSIQGHARLHREPELLQRYAEATTRKNNPDLPAASVPEAARRMAVKRTAVVIVAERVMSWDHRKLGGVY
jgi:hypothetical protein